MIDSFIAHINATTAWTGLTPIPDGLVRPHMFRKTMAMLTDQFAGSEIALGIQLKHVATRALANRSTQGYAAPAATWSDHLDSAIDAARFRRLQDLYQDHKAGEPIGYGPAAERIAATFTTIQDTVNARGGDATVERGLLRAARISLRFGTLNHCAFDETNPAGAVCLENATVPPGHTGPCRTAAAQTAAATASSLPRTCRSGTPRNAPCSPCSTHPDSPPVEKPRCGVNSPTSTPSFAPPTRTNHDRHPRLPSRDRPRRGHVTTHRLGPA